MADEPDLDQLAKQYLDLWQDHMQGMATDPQVAETMSQMTQMMTGSATAFAALAQQAMNAGKQPPKEAPSDDQQDDGNAAPGPTANGSGAPAPDPAHGGADVDLAELARRLDARLGRAVHHVRHSDAVDGSELAWAWIDRGQQREREGE